MRSILPVILLLMSSFMPQNLCAQDKPGDEHQSKLEIYKSDLKLNEQQYTQIKSILQSAREERVANKQKYASDRDALEKANKALKEATDKKILAILNDDQKAKYSQLKEELKEDRKKKAENSRVEERTAELTTELHLSADQTQKLRSILTNGAAELEKNHSQYTSDKDALSKANRSVNQSINTQILDLLDNSQKKAYALYKERKKAEHKNKKD